MASANPGPSAAPSVELVRAAQAGDLSALDRLFAQHYERLRLVVRARMGKRVRSYLESGDILQETFIAAVRNFERFEVRDEASFLHWLARIAENKICEAVDYNHAAKRDRRRDLALDHVQAAISSGELKLELVSIAPLPGVLLARGEQLDLVLDALQDVSADHREVIVLRYFIHGDGRWDEIGEAIGGKSAEAARMLHARALLALTASLKQRRGGTGQAED